jgi:hypothetical protein
MSQNDKLSNEEIERWRTDAIKKLNEIKELCEISEDEHDEQDEKRNFDVSKIKEAFEQFEALHKNELKAIFGSVDDKQNNQSIYLDNNKLNEIFNEIEYELDK